MPIPTGPAVVGGVFTVAVTGGIGSGKSEVARLLAERGGVLVDADALARDVVALGTPALEEITTEFGSGVLQPDGGLDRAKLASVVFGDPEKLRRLNAIVHPRVAERTRALVTAAPAGSIVVYDVPLLTAETASQWDLVVVVVADDDLRLERLVSSRGMSSEQVRSRMDSQPSPEQYLAVADLVIVNDGGLGRLRTEVARVWAHIAEASGST